jgi:hypothetical protein
MTDGAVKRQLPDDERTIQRLRTKLSRSRQGPQGDGQVVRRSLLAEGGWRQVDRQAAGRERHAGVLDRGMNSLAALLNRGIGEADNREVRKSARRVHFHLDDCPLQADDGAGVDLGEHMPSLDSKGRMVNPGWIRRVHPGDQLGSPPDSSFRREFRNDPRLAETVT